MADTVVLQEALMLMNENRRTGNHGAVLRAFRDPNLGQFTPYSAQAVKRNVRPLVPTV